MQATLNNFSGKSPDVRYRDEKWLREQYWSKGKSMTEMGEMCGVAKNTIMKWMNRYGIERRSRMKARPAEGPYADPEWCRKRYIDKEMTASDMAREAGVTAKTITKWMRRHGIELRDHSTTMAMVNRSEHCPTVWSNGYLTWQDNTNGRRDIYLVHRLAAIAEFGVEAVKGNNVHHANDIKWLNVPKFDMDIPELENPNLIPIDPVSHSRVYPSRG